MKIHSFFSHVSLPSRSQFVQRCRQKMPWKPRHQSWRIPHWGPGRGHYDRWSMIFIKKDRVQHFHLNLCSQLVVLLHDVVHVVLRHVCPLIRLLWNNVVWKISTSTWVLIASFTSVTEIVNMGSVTHNRSLLASSPFHLITRVVVGAGVVKTQLGGVQETRVSSPVSPNTLRMYLGNVMWIPSNHGFQNLTGTRNRMGRHQSWCQSEVEAQTDDQVF